MMQENSDSILVFEYFTASGEKDKCIISEAEALVFALLDDLSDFSVDLVINESYANALEGYENVNPILIDVDVVDWLEDNAANFNKAIFIAAENNNNLYNITKSLRKTMLKLTLLPLKHALRHQTNMKLMKCFPEIFLSLGHSDSKLTRRDIGKGQLKISMKNGRLKIRLHH